MRLLLLCLLLAPVAAAQGLPWRDAFDDAAAPGWTFRDDRYLDAPVRSGPGVWRVRDGALAQTSNIWVGDAPLEFALLLGTHAVAGSPAWGDYSFSATLRSTDNDGLGLLFRYRDDQNYYRFVLMNDPGNGGRVRRIERRTNGQVQILATQAPAQAYPNIPFAVTVDVRGDSIRAYVDGALVFALKDRPGGWATGQVGFSVYANDGATFDDAEVRAERVVRPAPPPPPVVVTPRTPYLQRPTPTSMLVAWRTAEAVTGAVQYGRTPALGLRIDGDEPSHEHALTLADLQPGTRYYYRVVNDGVPAAEVVSFVTAPPPGTATLSFMVLGDSGTGSPAQAAVTASMVRDLIAGDTATVALGLHVGDVHQGSGDDYDPIYFQPYAPLLARFPLMVSIGNHDTYHDDAATYLRDFYLFTNNPAQTERYYAYTYGPARFIVLDSMSPLEPGSPQLAWLADELASAETQAATWRVAYFHFPPYSAAWPEWDGDETTRQHVLPLFEQHGVDLVFNGHTHSYERGLRNGITYIITGGGGGGLDTFGRPWPHVSVVHLAHHYTRVDIEGPTLRLRALAPDGTVLDDHTLRKGAAGGGVVNPLEPALALAPPFPTPLRRGDTLTLAITLPAAGPFTLTALNALGQTVAQVADATAAAGPHRHTWTVPADLAPGPYFLRLQTRDGQRAAAFVVTD